MSFAIALGFILFVYFFSKNRWEASVTLFVAFVIMFTMFKGSDELLGFIDHRSIVSLLLIVTAYIYKDKSGIPPPQKLDKYKYLALSLLIFVMLFLDHYVGIKDAVILGEFTIGSALKRLLRDIIFVYAVILIVKRMHNPGTINAIDKGLFLGIIIAISSILFLDFFLELGFRLNKGIVIGDDENIRRTGFLGMNPNQAAGVFNTVYGYILARNENIHKFSRRHIIMVVLLLIGLFFFASKMGLAAFCLLTVLYLLKNSRSFGKTLLRISVITGIFIILYMEYGQLLEQRVDQQVSGEWDTLSSRQGYWVVYLTDIANNPEYLLFGNLDKPTHYRKVHNTYIHYLFRTGLIPFIIILVIFFKIYQHRNMYKGSRFYFNPVYPLLALLISWMTGAGYLNFWFVIIIALSSGIPYLQPQRNPNFLNGLNPRPYLNGPSKDHLYPVPRA